MADNIPSTDAGKAREGLIDELETINSYEEMASETSDPKLKAQFEEITDDERVHVGNFAEMVSEKDPKAEPMMKEGLKEAKEFGKSYRLYSFQEMMCGASHFKKTGSPNEAEMNYKHYLKMMQNRGKSSYSMPPKMQRPNRFGLTRKAQIAAKYRPWSRLNQMQDIYSGAADLLTPDMLGDEFINVWRNVGARRVFEFGGHNFEVRFGNDGVPYVFAYDPDMDDYVQLMRKFSRNGSYIDVFLTDKTNQHKPVREKGVEKTIVTPEIVRNEYLNGVDKGRYVKPRNSREVNFGQTLGPKFNMDEYLQSDESKWMDDKIEDYFINNPPEDVIWNDPSEKMRETLKGIPKAVQKLYKGMKTKGDFDNLYNNNETHKKNLDALLSAAGYNSSDPDFSKKMKAFTESITDKMPKVPKGKMRMEDYHKSLIDYLSRNDETFHKINTVSKMMRNTKKFIEDYPQGAEFIYGVAKGFLPEEEFNKLNQINNEYARLKEMANAVADDVYYYPEDFVSNTASGEFLENTIDTYATNEEVDKEGVFKRGIEDNMGDYLLNSSPTRKEMKQFLLGDTDNKNLSPWARDLDTKNKQTQKEIANTSLVPHGVSPDKLDGVERNWGEPRVPSKDGKAISISRITNENILSPDLLDKLSDWSSKNAEVAEGIAAMRRERDEKASNEEAALKNHLANLTDTPFNSSETKKKVPHVPTETESALIGAKTGDDSGQRDLIEQSTEGKPAEYNQDELVTGEFGQGPKPSRTRTQIEVAEKMKNEKQTKSFKESASFEEMLKSANARQWEEKGLPSGSMEATLPAYYRTVTIGSDRDAVNVYEHKKMPVGGDGINVKKVPSIGPKMSKKGDKMEPNEKAEPVKKTAGIREMIARNCFEKTGRIPDVEFMDTYEVKKAANETDINDLQGAASDEQPRGYGDVDEFGNSHHFSDERKAISDRVNTINPKRLNPGYERLVGTTGILDTPTDVGVELGDDVLNSAKSKGENPDAYLNFMRGPNSKAVIGVMKKHGFTDEEIQSTLKQVLHGYDYSEDYMDTY